MYVYLLATIMSMCMCRLVGMKNCHTLEGNRFSPKWKMLLVFFPIWFITVFRWDMAPDTTYGIGSYYQLYLNAQSGNFREDLEIVFYAIFNILARNGVSWFILLGIFSTVYIIAFAWFIQKMSCNPIFSILLYTSVGLLSFPFGALRQALAEVFVLLAYESWINQSGKAHKQYKTVFFLILGTLAHFSTLLFAISILVADFLISKRFDFVKMLAMSLLIIGVSPILGPLVVRIISTIPKWGTAYNGRSDFAITYVLLFGFCLFSFFPVLGKMKSLDEGIHKLVALLFVATIVMSYSAYLIDAYRISHIFSPIILIMAPISVRLNRKAFNRVLITGGYLVVCWILFWRQNSSTVYESVLPFIRYVL